MAGILNTIYVIAAVVVALGGLGVVVTYTDDPEPASKAYLSELTAVAVGLFVVAMVATMLV